MTYSQLWNLKRIRKTECVASFASLALTTCPRQGHRPAEFARPSKSGARTWIPDSSPIVTRDSTRFSKLEIDGNWKSYESTLGGCHFCSLDLNEGHGRSPKAHSFTIPNSSNMF